MKEIELSKGMVAIVSDCDYEFLMQHKWYLWSTAGPYAARNVYTDKGRRPLPMHRAVMINAGFDIEGKHIDHIDRCGLNNTRENLRIATRSQNMANKRVSPGNSSRFIGVFLASRIERKWAARIAKNGKKLPLGIYGSEEEAAAAYDKAAVCLHGEFAVLNFGETKEELLAMNLSPLDIEVHERQPRHGLNGVAPQKSKRYPWIAQIATKQEHIYLGKFKSKEEAAIAYDDAIFERFGITNKINFPERFQ